VVLVTSALPPEELLDALNAIEHRHGRVRLEHWGDRTLDLDLIDFAGLERNTQRLVLPHPRAAERSFVLVPWLQVDPQARLRGLGRVDELLAATTDEVWSYDAAPLMPHGTRPEDAR
jgi:7,8-dihydro-6-hydroxymethylpterin-pyrophosphokinase